MPFVSLPSCSVHDGLIRQHHNAGPGDERHHSPDRQRKRHDERPWTLPFDERNRRNHEDDATKKERQRQRFQLTRA